MEFANRSQEERVLASVLLLYKKKKEKQKVTIKTGKNKKFFLLQLV